jgi:hypothetical protein
MLYLFATATELGATKADQWVGQRVVELIEVGSPKFIGHLQSIGLPATAAATAMAWTKLLHYLGENRDSRWYGKLLEQDAPRLRDSQMMQHSTSDRAVFLAGIIIGIS